MAFLETLLLLTMITVPPSSANGSAIVSALFIFGDTFVDVGNNNMLDTRVRANFPPYGQKLDQGGTGRFSDGLLIHDFIASYMGLESPPPYLSSGNTSNIIKGFNFGSASSGLFRWDRSVLSFAEQVDSFEKVAMNGTGNVSINIASSIFYVCTGNVDVNSIVSFRGSSLSPRLRLQLLSELRTQLLRLYHLGARKFVVVGLTAIGCSPKNQQYGRCSMSKLWASTYFNRGLSVLLADLRNIYSDVHVVMANLESILLEAKTRPSSYGFSNTIQGCCPADNPWTECYRGASVCSNSSEYLFWDINNPTQAFNNLVALRWWNGSSDYVWPMNLLQLAAT